MASVMLIKPLSQYLISCATAMLLASSLAPAAALAAEPCVYQCDSNQIRFVPGQPITIEFVNKTNGLIHLERVLDINLEWLRPNSEFSIQTLVGVDDDMSLVFWDDHNRAVNAVLHRPDAATLQIELLPSGAESDRAVHIANDGRVIVY
ncbi:MAG: hypothetical protein HC800_00465 [Phormidesmis sp. RL_2_1]|nr:hypothetical protein [Phormidesmis sp. RL_2_1]